MPDDATDNGEQAAPFEVVEEWEEREVVIHRRSRVVLRTDDGIEAEAYRIANSKPYSDHGPHLRVRGVDPSHLLGEDGRCSTCNVPLDNGCYGSHLPCGFNTEGHSLMSIVHEWSAAHAARQTPEES
jgi:hypothetical protein